MPLNKVLIVADGEKLTKERLVQLPEPDLVVVLDGAHNYAREMELQVDYLLGDFDTIDPELLEQVRQEGKTIIEHLPDQSATDLDKAIQFVLKLRAKEIHIACALGGRTDHGLHNIRLLSRYAQQDIYLYSPSETLFVLQDQQLTYKLNKGDGFSLMPAPTATVTTKGLAYDMQEYVMDYAGKDSSCNWAVANTIAVAVCGTILAIHKSL